MNEDEKKMIEKFKEKKGVEFGNQNNLSSLKEEYEAKEKEGKNIKNIMERLEKMEIDLNERSNILKKLFPTMD